MIYNNSSEIAGLYLMKGDRILHDKPIYMIIDVFLKVFIQDNNFSGILIYFAIYFKNIFK